MATCKDIMTSDPVCCEPADSVLNAAQFMRREDVGALPVVDGPGSRHLIGLVTDRDIVVKVLAAGLDPRSATVRDAMTSHPVCCQEDDDVDEAMRMMAERQVRRMPIVSADGELRGIIAQADVATRAHQDRRTGELVQAISEPDEHR